MSGYMTIKMVDWINGYVIPRIVIYKSRRYYRILSTFGPFSSFEGIQNGRTAGFWWRGKDEGTEGIDFHGCWISCEKIGVSTRPLWHLIQRSSRCNQVEESTIFYCHHPFLLHLLFLKRGRNINIQLTTVIIL